MATRKTLREAQELAEKWQTQYPDATFRIEDIAPWGFDVLEARVCRICGSEYLTAAIGEYDGLRCDACEQQAREESRESSKRALATNKARQAQQEFYDAHMI